METIASPLSEVGDNGDNCLTTLRGRGTRETKYNTMCILTFYSNVTHLM